jgi:hypothetical protein
VLRVIPEAEERDPFGARIIVPGAFGLELTLLCLETSLTDSGLWAVDALPWARFPAESSAFNSKEAMLWGIYSPAIREVDWESTFEDFSASELQLKTEES